MTSKASAEAIPCEDGGQPVNSDGHYESTDLPLSSPIVDSKITSIARSKSNSDSSLGSFVPQSITSTLQWNQTPFAEFRDQVNQLCHSLWPASTRETRAEGLVVAPNSGLLGRLRTRTLNRFLRQPSIPNQSGVELPPQREFLIERMSGGSFNRIVGISITGSEGGDATQLVLRLPRIPWAVKTDREVATLNYVRQHTSIPVPEVKEFDFTDDNAVNSPYVVQNRVPGIDLSTAISNGLSHKQWCILAKEIGRIVHELQNVTNPTPGLVETANQEGGEPHFKIVPFDIRNPRDPEWKEKQMKCTTLAEDNAKTLQWYSEDTLNFFATQFGRSRAEELTRVPTSILDDHQMQRLAEVASAMDRLGVFGDNENCLAHLDLAPRNIMVQVDTDESIQVTAVLDWDSAVFAPKLVSCRPPWWLWQDEKYDGIDPMEDETNADDEPEDPELLEIKNLFEDTVGDDWYRCAYQTQYRLARRLFKVATHGKCTNEMWHEIENVIAEWAAFYKAEVEDYVPEDDRQSTGSDGSRGLSTYTDGEEHQTADTIMSD